MKFIVVNSRAEYISLVIELRKYFNFSSEWKEFFEIDFKTALTRDELEYVLNKDCDVIKRCPPKFPVLISYLTEKRCDKKEGEEKLISLDWISHSDIKFNNKFSINENTTCSFLTKDNYCKVDEKRCDKCFSSYISSK